MSSFWRVSGDTGANPQGKDALCDPYRPYHLAGTRYDMDPNVLLGDSTTLDELFSPVAQS